MEAKKGSTLASKASSARRARCSSELKALRNVNGSRPDSSIGPMGKSIDFVGFFPRDVCKGFFFQQMVVFFSSGLLKFKVFQ